MATLITKNSSTASAVPAAGDLVKGELAVNVTDKKVYTKDNSAAVVKLVGSLGNQEANAVAVTGGTINGTTIGATTPSTGAFTTASASSGFTGNLTGNVTGNVSGTAANVTGVVAIANGGTGLSALGTGVQSALGQAVTGSGSFVLSTSPSLTTPNLGTPSAAVLTNATGLPLTTGVTGTLGVANGGTGITAFGTGVATALGQNVTGSGGIVLATSPSLTTPNLGTPSAATLTNATGLPISTGVSGLGTGVATALGVAVGSAGAFVVNGGALGTPSSGTLTNATGLPISTGVSGLGTGVATALAVNTGSAGAFVVNGGALGTPSSGTLTNATGLPLSTGVTGTLATTNGGTGLTSFTANGVVYASSSSALTTGSDVVYTGNFGIGTSSPTYKLNVVSGAGAQNIFQAGQSGVSNGYTITSDGTNLTYQWFTPSTEAMRLTSTGLGIGTSSPLGRLTIQGAAGTSGINQGIGLLYSNGTQYGALGLNNSSGWPQLMARAGAGMTFHVNSDLVTTGEAMRLDSSGNLGLGVTPSAWYPGFKAFQAGATTTLTDYSSGTYLLHNWYIATSGANTYLTSNFASAYKQVNGAHVWDIAPSGTAGNTISFTTAMTLDASGNLMIGATSTSYRLDVVGTAAAGYTVTRINNLSSTGYARVLFDIGANGANGQADISYAPGNFFAIGPSGNDTTTPIVFRNNNATERARITSGGNLLVGTTTDPAYSGYTTLVLNSNTNGGLLDIQLSGSRIGSLQAGSSTELRLYAGASVATTLYGGGTERARITSGGYFCVGSTTDTRNIYAGGDNSLPILTVRATAASGVLNGINANFNGQAPNNTTSFFLQCNDTGAERATIRSNGGLANYQSNNVDLSDARTKKEITPAPSYWGKIGALEIVTYKYNDQTHDDVNVGVIAQQVESVEPVWVDADGFGETPEDGVPLKTVYTKDITFAAIKALQEAMARIEQLEAKVAALEAK